MYFRKHYVQCLGQHFVYTDLGRISEIRAMFSIVSLASILLFFKLAPWIMSKNIASVLLSFVLEVIALVIALVIRVALFNVRSIINMRRRRALMTALTACDCDVFALTETWLTENILDSELQIAGFNI